VANRRRAELEALIGFFVNTVVLRVTVDDEQSIDEFMSSVKAVSLNAYDRQDMPFERLVEILRPQRSLNRHPVFQVMISLQNAPVDSYALPGLKITLEAGVNETAKFDLLLALEERGTEIVGYLNYDADLFDRKTIERWAAYFHVLLGDMTAGVSRKVGELKI